MEAGLLLIVAPWTTFWERNSFGVLVPALGAWMASPFVRGAVTGIGVITAIGGLLDLTGTILARPTAAARIASPESGPTER